MFLIEKKREDGFEKIILRDTVSGTYATVLPDCGAILHAFVVKKENEEINVIAGYDSMEDFRTSLTVKGFRGSKLSPFAGRIKSGEYQFGEKKLKIEKHYFQNNAMHGELFDKQFSIIDESANSDFASITMIYSYKKEDAGYPFSYDCEITWKLESKNLLTATTRCTNRDEGIIPLQDGWHPYFTLGDEVDDYLLEFQSMEKYEVDENQIPNGEKTEYDHFNSLKPIGGIHFDDCFSLNMNTCQPLAVIKNPKRKIRVDIFPSKDYPFLQLFTPDDRKNIAIENMSAPPDTFNSGEGLRVLLPEESVSFKVGYQIVIW